MFLTLSKLRNLRFMPNELHLVWLNCPETFMFDYSFSYMFASACNTFTCLHTWLDTPTKYRLKVRVSCECPPCRGWPIGPERDFWERGGLYVSHLYVNLCTYTLTSMWLVCIYVSHKSRTVVTSQSGQSRLFRRGGLKRTEPKTACRYVYTHTILQ